MWSRETVKSWAEFQRAIEKFLDGDSLFRGVASAEYPLVPAVGRERAEFSYSLALEKDIFEAFKREALPLLPARPADSWEWLALAQHFGVPTRLLDWSESPYVSAFFAAWSGDDANPALYIVKRPRKTVDTEEWKSPFQAKGVAFYYPGHVTARLVSQRGLFTVHERPQDVYAPEGMHQIIIDKGAKGEFRRNLDTCGFHHGSIFADLDGLARRLVALRGFREVAPPASATTTASAGRPKVNPNDPQKGQWGGRDRRDGWQLTAKVREVSKDWFAIRLAVEPEANSGKTLKQGVTFHLHDSFHPSVRSGELLGKRAVLDLRAYGAFTVGVEVEQDGTQLELDLAELSTAPEAFRER
jgi:hypothetical protein